MKRLTTFMILVAFGLTIDRGVNSGAITIELAAVFDQAKDWTVRSSGRVANSLYDFGRG